MDENPQEIVLMLSRCEINLLRLFKPETYSLSLRHEGLQNLLNLGLLDWVPRVFGVGIDYTITDLGRAVVECITQESE